MTTTLAEVLSTKRVEFDELEQRYDPVLNLVNVLIGVVPYCDRYLEIWPPGFRTYNLMVPNFLNLPQSLLGRGAPKDVVGLGMYTSSRAANCMYCSAHTCSFALRRGSSAEAVTGESRTPAEAAAVAIAEGLSTMPHHYTPTMKAELHEHFSADDAEWIVMGVAMMGFLNKFMDAIGVELEPEAVDDVADLIEPTGWSVGQHGWADLTTQLGGEEEAEAGRDLPPGDSVGTYLKVFRNAPGAVKLEREWMKGLPKSGAQLRLHISENYGMDEPILTSLRHARVARALGAMLRHNLDPEQSELGIGTKALVGLVFAQHAGNRKLAAQSRALAERHGVDPAWIEAAAGFEPGSAKATVFDDATRAALTTAFEQSPSPATVGQDTVELAAAHLGPDQIIEVAVWVSVCQLLHRLGVYFEMAG